MCDDEKVIIKIIYNTKKCKYHLIIHPGLTNDKAIKILESTADYLRKKKHTLI